MPRGDERGPVDGAAMPAGEVLERFLAGRAERTRQAYAADLVDFARFCARPPAEAVAALLADPQQGQRLVLEYVLELHRQRRSQATVDRRLATLRSLARTARRLGVVDWPLETPDEQRLAAAHRPSGDAYVLPRHPTELDRLDIQHFA